MLEEFKDIPREILFPRHEPYDYLIGLKLYDELMEFFPEEFKEQEVTNEVEEDLGERINQAFLNQGECAGWIQMVKDINSEHPC